MKNHPKKIGLYTLVLLVSILLVMPAVAEDTYKVDTAHTYILFKVKHLGIGYSYGRFNNPVGTFTFDEAKNNIGVIDIRILAKDVDTDVEKRDNHLRSPDFFDAKKHPLISFKSTSVKKTGQGTYEISGNVTLLGKTQTVKAEAVQTGAGKDPWGKYRRGYEARFTLKRSEFGMEFMLGGVSDKVELTISVEGVRQ
jgi:polyisoprenoid-binding protein YceI